MKIYNVLGVQRTGQHAVISWIIGHFEKVAFKNNMSYSDNPKRGLVPPFWYFTPSIKDE